MRDAVIHPHVHITHVKYFKVQYLLSYVLTSNFIQNVSPSKFLSLNVFYPHKLIKVLCEVAYFRSNRPHSNDNYFF